MPNPDDRLEGPDFKSQVRDSQSAVQPGVVPVATGGNHHVRLGSGSTGDSPVLSSTNAATEAQNCVESSCEVIDNTNKPPPALRNLEQLLDIKEHVRGYDNEEIVSASSSTPGIFHVAYGPNQVVPAIRSYSSSSSMAQYKEQVMNQLVCASGAAVAPGASQVGPGEISSATNLSGPNFKDQVNLEIAPPLGGRRTMPPTEGKMRRPIVAGEEDGFHLPEADPVLSAELVLPPFPNDMAPLEQHPFRFTTFRRMVSNAISEQEGNGSNDDPEILAVRRFLQQIMDAKVAEVVVEDDKRDKPISREIVRWILIVGVVVLVFVAAIVGSVLGTHYTHDRHHRMSGDRAVLEIHRTTFAPSPQPAKDLQTLTPTPSGEDITTAIRIH
jgi:hypothetical protein